MGKYRSPPSSALPTAGLRGGLLPQNRSRREALYVVAVIVVACFCIWRICQFGAGVPQANTVMAVIQSTQVLSGSRDGQELQEPAKLYTEFRFGREQRESRGRGGRKQMPEGRRPEPTKGEGLEVLKGMQSSRTQPGQTAQQAAQQQTRQQAAQQIPGSKLPADIVAQVPADFDWSTYLLYHPELREQEQVHTEDDAKQHYVEKGKAEGRFYKRLRVLLRYTACTGLINQQYSHIAAFSLSAVLGAELVLAPAVKRDSFANYFSTFKDQNEVSWTAAPLSSLLDVESIIHFWQQRGLVVHNTPALTPFPDLTQPEVAFPLYPHPEIDPRLVTHLDNVYLQNLDMPELIEKARVAVIGHATALLKAEPQRSIDYVVLDLPCTFFMLRSLSNLRVVTEVARSLTFAPEIQRLADRVIAGMTAGGQTEYNAVHLRIEKDARDWSTIMGGEAVVWHNYIMAMQKAGFSPDLGLYAASGLLTYGASAEMDNIVQTLLGRGLCNKVHYKELYLPREEIEALNSEQKALLDFLVLSRGKNFVGFGSSTFSFYLREHRALSAIPRSSSVLVDASVIGTDPLFNSAGTII